MDAGEDNLMTENELNLASLLYAEFADLDRSLGQVRDDA